MALEDLACTPHQGVSILPSSCLYHFPFPSPLPPSPYCTSPLLAHPPRKELTNLRPRHNRFLQAGAAKVYISSRKASACAAACAELNALPNRAPGAQAISVPADSATIQGVEQLVRAVSATTDHVDILFANAGATWGEAFDTHPDSAFAKVMDLNVKSVFNTIRL